ncbi:hypothetical protein MRX96_051865 [Rhipicephalus microplus]
MNARRNNPPRSPPPRRYPRRYAPPYCVRALGLATFSSSNGHPEKPVGCPAASNPTWRQAAQQTAASPILTGHAAPHMAFGPTLRADGLGRVRCGGARTSTVPIRRTEGASGHV